MKLHLTPDLMEAAYNLLKAAPPFKRWQFPSSDDVEFYVTRHRDRFADYELTKKGRHRFRFSQKFHTRLDTLMATMAHELIHMRQQLLDPKLNFERRPCGHGEDFHKMADQICRIFGFVRETF